MNVVGFNWGYKIKKKADKTVECNKARLVPRVFINNRASTLGRHLVQLLNLGLFVSFYLLLSLKVGPIISLMSRMPSFMGLFLKLYICLIPRDLLMLLIRIICTNFTDLFMASNRLYEHSPN